MTEFGGQVNVGESTKVRISTTAVLTVATEIIDNADSFSAGPIPTLLSVAVPGEEVYQIEFTPTVAGTWSVVWKDAGGVVDITNVLVGGDLFSGLVGVRTEITQAFTGVGGITENDGLPIENVRVRAFNASEQVVDESYSDLNGNFTLFLNAGTYRLEFFKLNFTRADSAGVVVT